MNDSVKWGRQKTSWVTAAQHGDSWQGVGLMYSGGQSIRSKWFPTGGDQLAET